MCAEIINMELKSSAQITEGPFLMRTSLPTSVHTIRQAAWLLGIEQDDVCRAIRLGTLRTVRRRGRLVIPTSALMSWFGPGVLRD